MKAAAMIQARCGSSRLPGKILMDLCGKPVLRRVIERVRRSRFVDEVFVVTSIGRENLPVLELCASLGVRVYAGAEEDVLDRYYQLARLIRPDYVVRVTADCPCFDWELLDQAASSMAADAAYLSDFGETLPDGLDLEIIRFDALERSWREARLASEREHMTQYIRKHPQLFPAQDFRSPIEGIGRLRWTLDEAEDLTLIQTIYEHFCGLGKEDFLTRDILDYLRENPGLSRINEKYARNEGLAKSLRKDRLIEQT